jgi:hypothetical protein
MLSESKRCTKCCADKPLPEFSKAPRGKYGVKATCKACDAERARANFTSRAMPPDEVKHRLEERRGDTKRCTKCEEVKPRTEFSKSYDGKHGPVLRSWCKPCSSARVRAWHADNPGRVAGNRRKANLARHYGLTVAEYDAMLRAQGGVCAICNRPERVERNGKVMRMPVDHDHATGAVRGLLCHSCNRAIGLLGDDAALMRRAISYLLRHRNKQDG